MSHLERGTVVAIQAGEWHGVLIRGPSGSGKSDLALRLLHHGGDYPAKLVSDDYAELSVAGENVLASPASGIEGLLEVRGIGVTKQHVMASVPLRMAVKLTPSEDIDRLPERQYLTLTIEGTRVKLPQFDLDPFGVSAVPKVLSALTVTLNDREKEKGATKRQ